MGNFLAHLHLNEDFQKSSALPDPGKCQAFYDALKEAIKKIDATEERDISYSHSLIMNWNREADIVYESTSDFPSFMQLKENELAVLPSPGLTQGETQNCTVTPPSSKEEAILLGLCSSKQSTSDATFAAIKDLEKKYQGDELLKILSKYPRAARLYTSQQMEVDGDMGTGFKIHQLQRDYGRASFIVGKSAWSEQAYAQKVKRLQAMIKLLQESLKNSNNTATSRSRDTFHLAMSEEMLDLLETQKQLEISLGITCFIGCSLVETVQKLLVLYPAHPEALQRAIEVGERFLVAPRQFWWCLLKILSQREQWQVIFLLVAAGRPPFGYVPVVEVLLDEDHPDIAQDIIGLIKDLNERQQVVTILAQYEEDKAKEIQQMQGIPTSKPAFVAAPPSPPFAGIGTKTNL
jgi:hypothetical protein